MTRKLIPVALLAVLTLAAAPALANDLWFHVTVNEHSGENANITVNLPISIVEKALALIPEDAMQGGRIKIEDEEFDANRLRELWSELRNSPDMEFVTVRTDDETIRVYKENGFLVARTTESSASGTEIHARLPMDVVEALLSGDGDELNVEAALQALVSSGQGELVTVNDKDATVRVWIDHNPEAG